MSISRVYIDIEYDYKWNIIEFAAVEVKNEQIKSILHRFVLPQKHMLWYTHEKYAKYSNCIPRHVIKEQGIKLSQLQDEFKIFLNEIVSTKIIIKGHGADVDEPTLKQKFPFLSTKDLVYMQVNLPPWKERKYGVYHIATHYMKQFSRIMPCLCENHSLPFKFSDKINHSRISKNFYGFHCALFDSIELAFYEQYLPLYQCDECFKSVFDSNFLVFEYV